MKRRRRNGMIYTMSYKSPLGEILLAGDGQGLVGLWLEGERYYANCLNEARRAGAFPAYDRTKTWLDIYFSGREPHFFPPIHMVGTEFQISVWNILAKIPYGKTVTYGEIARQIAQSRGIRRMSSQAVGGAVGHNEISIIIPCHRVIGANGSLTGYAGGIDKKIKLLALEGVETKQFSVSR